MFGRMVVGVDGAEGGLDAAALAGVLAAGGDVILTHVETRERRRDLPDPDAALAEAELALTLSAGGSPRPEVRRSRFAGRAVADGLRQVATGEWADAIVVGSHHRTGVGRLWSPDRTGATLRSAPCPVAVAPVGYRERPSSALRVVGVGYDDTPQAQAALFLGRRVARRAGASLHALWVVDRSNWPDAEAGAGARAVNAARRLAEIDDIVGITVEGDAHAAWDALADFSRRVDLLVLGSHHHGLLRRVLVGDTVRGLVRRAACPILVMPHF